MGFIPDEIKQEILDRTDITEVIAGYFPLQNAGRNKKACCPFHPEDTPSFIVNPVRQRYHCFGCGKDGNVISFVMEYEHLTYPEAMEKLAARCGVQLPKKELTPVQKQCYGKKRRIMEINRDALEFFGRELSNSHLALDYVEQRHITPELVQSFGLGYAPDSWTMLLDYLKAKGYKEPELVEAGIINKKEETGRCYDMFRNRLMFPVFDRTGNVIAFSGRALDDSPAKYVNSPETPAYRKSDNLFGLYQALNEIRRSEEAILLEGNIDVTTAHKWGITNAVAPLGTAFTPDQALVLKRYAKRVTVMFDGDSAGEKACDRAMDILITQGIRCYAAALPEGRDPDDLLNEAGGREAWDEIMAGRLPYMDYKIALALKKHDIAMVEGKALIGQELLPALALVRDSIERNDYLAKIGSLLGIAPEELINRLKQQRSQNNNYNYNNGSNSNNFNPAVDFGDFKEKEGRQQAVTRVLYYAAEHREVFEEIMAKTGWSFVTNPGEKEIILLLKEKAGEYSWKLRDLPDLAKDDRVRQIAGAFIIRDPYEDSEQWENAPKREAVFAECWKTLRRASLQEELSKLQQEIKSCESSVGGNAGADNGNREKLQELLKKFAEIRQELQKI